MIATLVGSRKITPCIAELCNIIGSKLSDRNFIARSGGASGCDTEFLRYYNKQLTEVYIPWDGFSNGMCIDNLDKEKAAMILSSIVDIQGLKESIVKLYTRNVFQVLGKNLDQPSDILLYYSPMLNGIPKGGTKIAYMLAKRYKIKCVDIMDYKHLVEKNRLQF